MPSKTPRGDKPEPGKQIVDAAMRLAADKAWTKISIGEIAQAAGVSSAEIYRHFQDRQAILDTAMSDVDRAMLATAIDLADPLKDRLFEILMSRFDALRPYKAAITPMAKRLRRGKSDAVIMGLAAAKRLTASMRQALEAAGVPISGAGGDLQATLLGAVFTSASRIWLNDESDDLAETMAHLDRGLRRMAPLLKYKSGNTPENFVEETATPANI